MVGWQRDDATRRKVLTTFTYDTSRCMFCGIKSEDACPTDCLELTQDFEMATIRVKALSGIVTCWRKGRPRRATFVNSRWLLSYLACSALQIYRRHSNRQSAGTSCRSSHTPLMELRKDPITRSWVRTGHREELPMPSDAVRFAPTRWGRSTSCCNFPLAAHRKCR